MPILLTQMSVLYSCNGMLVSRNSMSNLVMKDHESKEITSSANEIIFNGINI